jgi:hypothetical protein
MPRKPDKPVSAKDKAVGEIIERAVIEHKVQRWLDGSKLKADRPTLAELESCGFVVKTGID